MKNLLFRILLIVSVFIVFFGCAGKNAKVSSPPFSPKTFPLDKYGPRVDAFAVLFDASASMEKKIDSHWIFFWRGTKEFKIAKEFVSRMNKTLPEQEYQGVLRTFGHHSEVSKEKTALFFGLSQYSETGFEKGLDAVKKPGGNTPMAEAIDAAGKDLKSIKGQIAVIIVSDGDKITNAVNAAKTMKQKYGERLCIYAVHVGNDPGGKAYMDELVRIGQCGFSVNASDSSSAEALADFVEKVFLVKYIDSDGDGVYDHLDQCPGTPKGVEVDEKGCPIPRPAPKPAAAPLDSDGDGVYDDKDKCPDTPAGAQVDERGCWVIRTVEFDFDKYNIKEQYYPRLNKVVGILKNIPTLRVEIAGHTDNMGTARYNQTLSEKRARAVKAYLVSKGISADRLTTVGYGLTKPVASNATEEGRAKNRRVELTPIK